MSITSVSEYFARNERKSPVWKSHEEFLFCLGSSVEKASEIASFVAPLISYLNDVEDLSHTKQIDNSLYDDIQSDEELEGKEELIKILDIIKDYRLEDGSDGGFIYVMLPARNRFYTKIDSKNIFIKFDDTPNGYSTYDTFEDKKIDVSKRDYEFFYLYSKTKLNSKHYLEYLYTKIQKSSVV